MEEGKKIKSAIQQLAPSGKLPLNVVCVLSRTNVEEMSTCYCRDQVRALTNTLHVFCGWPDRRGGLKVDGSVMHDSGTGFSANGMQVLLAARSAFYSLRSTRNLWISTARHTSADWWASVWVFNSRSRMLKLQYCVILIKFSCVGEHETCVWGTQTQKNEVRNKKVH